MSWLFSFSNLPVASPPLPPATLSTTTTINTTADQQDPHVIDDHESKSVSLSDSDGSEADPPHSSSTPAVQRPPLQVSSLETSSIANPLSLKPISPPLPSLPPPIQSPSPKLSPAPFEQKPAVVVGRPTGFLALLDEPLPLPSSPVRKPWVLMTPATTPSKRQ